MGSATIWLDLFMEECRSGKICLAARFLGQRGILYGMLMKNA